MTFKKIFMCFRFCFQHLNAETDGLDSFINICVFRHSKTKKDNQWVSIRASEWKVQSTAEESRQLISISLMSIRNASPI